MTITWQPYQAPSVLDGYLRGVKVREQREMAEQQRGLSELQAERERRGLALSDVQLAEARRPVLYREAVVGGADAGKLAKRFPIEFQRHETSRLNREGAALGLQERKQSLAAAQAAEARATEEHLRGVTKKKLTVEAVRNGNFAALREFDPVYAAKVESQMAADLAARQQQTSRQGAFFLRHAVAGDQRALAQYNALYPGAELKSIEGFDQSTGRATVTLRSESKTVMDIAELISALEAQGEVGKEHVFGRTGGQGVDLVGRGIKKRYDPERDANVLVSNLEAATNRSLEEPRDKRVTDARRAELEKALEGARGLASVMSKGFNPEYFGHPLTGDLQIDVAGSFDALDGVVGPKGLASFWKQYQGLQLEKLHEFFGAALTKTELQMWNRTVIGVGTAPKQAKKFIVRKLRILHKALGRIPDMLRDDRIEPEVVNRYRGRTEGIRTAIAAALSKIGDVPDSEFDAELAETEARPGVQSGKQREGGPSFDFPPETLEALHDQASKHAAATRRPRQTGIYSGGSDSRLSAIRD